MKKDDQKGLLNEVLPDPKQAERDLQRGSPRDRTAAHLRRIVAAAAAALMPVSGALADNSVPGDKGKSNNKGSDAQKPPDTPPPQPPGYGVVNPMPQPYVNPSGKTGLLTVTTTPAGASVMIDGEDIGKKTPLKKFKIGVGSHTLTVTAPDGTSRNAPLDVQAGKTIKETIDLRPPPKEPKK